jgi:hypothetical protein
MLCDMQRPKSEFQQLAPLIVSREPVGVRRVLVRRARGHLTFAATLEELEQLPVSNAVELLSKLNVMQAYDAAVDQWRDTGTDKALSGKNAAWFTLERVRAAIQGCIRRLYGSG